MMTGAFVLHNYYVFVYFDSTSLIMHCHLSFPKYLGGVAEAQLVERATPGEEILGSIPAVAACSLFEN